MTNQWETEWEGEGCKERMGGVRKTTKEAYPRMGEILWLGRWEPQNP